MAWLLSAPAVLLHLAEETFREWKDDRATSQGAALAFYALFAAAPLVLFTTGVLGHVMGAEVAQQRLQLELRALLTPEVADAVSVLVADTHTRDGGLTASYFGLVAGAYGALQGFARLQSTLNMVWGVRAVRGPGMLQLVRRKLLAFASILSCGALLLGSIALTIVLQWLTARSIPERWYLGRLSEEASTLLLAAVLLTVVYKTLPDVRIRWRDVLVGALFSAVLFLGGKHVVALYLRTVGISTGWGAASAVVALLLYAQYIAQVLLFGAEFTFVFARWRGQPILPGPGAARVVRTFHED